MRQLATTTCYERAVECTCTSSSVNSSKCAKSYEQYASIPRAERQWPSLEDDELDGVLSLKLVNDLDDVAVAVLAKVLGARVCQGILVLDAVDADIALLHQFLHEKTLSAMCFARGL